MKNDDIWTPLDDYIKEMPTRATRSFNPSDASCIVNGKLVGTCLRKQYYKWKGVPSSPIDYRTYMTFRLGSAFEKAFLEGYQKKGLLRGQDVPFKATICGLKISGRLDGLTWLGEVIECKSSYGKAFLYSVGKKPKMDNLCQIMCYLAVLGLDVCLLPYGSRDDQAERQGYKIRKRDIEREGILFIGIIQRWKILQLHLGTNLVPERDYKRGDWQCNYCGYKQLCYAKPKETDLISALL